MTPLDDRRIDGRQVSALLLLYRRLGFRAARDSGTGKSKGGPLLIIPSYLLFGGLLIPTLEAAAEARTALIMLATAVLGMSALTLIPDALETQQARIEILSTKPIGERTFALAQALTNLRGLAIVVGSLLLPGSWWLKSTMDVPIPTLLVFGLLTLLTAFALQILWLSLLLALAARLSYERIRTAAQAILMTVLLTSWLPGFVFRALRGDDDLASFRDAPWIQALPPSWVVDAYGQGSGPNFYAPRIGLAALFMGAMLLRRYTTTRHHQRRLFEVILQPPAKTGRPSLELRFLGVLARLGLARGPSLGVARLILLAMAREDHARLRRMSLRVLMLLNVGAAWLMGLPLMAGVPTGTLAAMLLATELDLIKDSQQAGAAWILEAAPIHKAEISAGARLALLVSFWSYSGPLLLLGVLPSLSPWIGLTWLLALFLSTYNLLSMALLIRAPRPLSREPRGGFHLTTLLVAFVFGTLGGLTQAAFDFQPLPVVALLLLLALLLRHRGRDRPRMPKGLAPQRS